MELIALVATSGLLGLLLVLEKLDRRSAEREWRSERSQIVERLIAKQYADERIQKVLDFIHPIAPHLTTGSVPSPPPPPPPKLRQPVDAQSSGPALEAGARRGVHFAEEG